MVKYLMRKFMYNNCNTETQDMLLQLSLQQDIITLICLNFWIIIFIFTFIPLIIVVLLENVELSINTQIALITFMLIYGAIILLLGKFLKEAFIAFINIMAGKIFFLMYTGKGNAISKKDFQTIKNSESNLYDLIATGECQGYCYSTCFHMLKIFEKGYIEFIAIKKFSSMMDDEHDDGRKFTMHVLYINDGWAFDTYSRRQYPIEKIYAIYKAKTYKIFTFEDISNQSYEDFMEQNKPELLEWCKYNDCTYCRY